ncbi:MAG: hypothetical protein KDB48_05265, partial [Solirubrobacterales bacterium]|nr:hypothetical protein [Solirubrobacterales bacterium]
IRASQLMEFAGTDLVVRNNKEAPGSTRSSPLRELENRGRDVMLPAIGADPKVAAMDELEVPNAVRAQQPACFADRDRWLARPLAALLAVEFLAPISSTCHFLPPSIRL